MVIASVKAAEMRGLSLDPATSANLQALGIELQATEPRFGDAARAAVAEAQAALRDAQGR